MRGEIWDWDSDGTCSPFFLASSIVERTLPMKPGCQVPGDETSIWARNEVGSESRTEVADSLVREN